MGLQDSVRCVAGSFPSGADLAVVDILIYIQCHPKAVVGTGQEFEGLCSAGVAGGRKVMVFLNQAGFESREVWDINHTVVLEESVDVLAFSHCDVLGFLDTIFEKL